MSEPNTVGDQLISNDTNLILGSGVKLTINDVPIMDAYACTGWGDINPGQASFSRYLIGSSGINLGYTHFVYFRGNRTEAITTVKTQTSATAATTPTVCKIGIYQVAANGDVTRIAVTANDTAMWTATYTLYTKTLTPTFNKVAGQLYAAALICAGGAAPTLTGISTPAWSTDVFMGAPPRLFGMIAAQTDLLASYTNAQIGPSRMAPYVEMTP